VLTSILAVAEPGSLDLAVFAQYGVLGILALMLIFFARGAHQRERDRADRLEAENQRLHELIIDRVIPALGSATRAAEEAADLLAAMQRERELTAVFARRRDVEGGPT
jgi:hypothetical protein